MPVHRAHATLLLERSLLKTTDFHSVEVSISSKRVQFSRFGTVMPRAIATRTPQASRLLVF
ncbi:MAG: hypothetical protein ACYTXF_35525 [Nostoc sp.]